MTAKKPEPPAPPAPQTEIVDSPNAPDVFASWVEGYSRRQGNVHISLAADRFSHSTNKARLVVIGRLVMPIEGALDMVRGLRAFLKDIGADPDAPPPAQDPKRTLQ